MYKIILSQEQLNELKKIELEILCELDRICKKHNIKYTLGYGTLIGAIRHNGFIPWDDDIDVCMPRNDYVRFKEICVNELDKKFFYQSHDTDSEYYHLFNKIRVNNTVFRETFLDDYDIHHGVYLDIFPIDNLPDCKWKRVWQYLQYRLCRVGLNSKYLVLKARRGKKKIAATIIRILYIPFSNEFLYKRAEKIATKYNESSQKYACCYASAYKLRDIFPANYYTEITGATFEGNVFNIPSHYDEMLRKIYGDYMQLPPADERCTRHDLTALEL